MAIFYNQATLSYNGNVTASNMITGEIVEVLSASKNAVVDTYSPENETVFVITAVNSGNEDYTGLTITDDLGEYTFGEEEIPLVPLTYTAGSVNYYINGVQQPAPMVTSTSPLVISGIDVPAEGNAVIIYSAKANSFAPMGSGAIITNTAAITGPGVGTPIIATAVISALDTADLTISKSLTPSAVQENGQLTYTFVIQNYGSLPATADDTVIFRDVFDPIIVPAEVVFNDRAWVQGVNYNYDLRTGEFTSVEGQITVPEADFTQDDVTGAWTVKPGTSILTIKGRITTG